MTNAVTGPSVFNLLDAHCQCFHISPIVRKLTSKLPDLLSKIESINQQLLPLGNISDNVDHIRELIQQARDAANKVGEPVPARSSSETCPFTEGERLLPESPLLSCPNSSVA